MPGYRDLSRNQDFSVLWIGQTISELGSRVSMFVFPLTAYAISGSTLATATAEAFFLLGMVAGLVPGGVLADRVDRRRVMRVASGSGVLLYVSLAVAGIEGALTLPHLFVVALLTGAGTGVFSPAETSAVRAVVPPADLPTALSQNQARVHVAGLVGGPLGGALYGVTRWLPFIADALSFAVSWTLLGRIRTDLSAPERIGPRPSVRQDVAEGVRFIARHPLFRVLATFSALCNLTLNALMFVAVLRLIQAGTPAWQIGLVETAAGAGGLLGAIVAPWVVDRFPTGWLTIVSAWMWLPMIVPLARWNQPVVVAAALGVGLLLNPAGNAGIGAYRIAVTPPELVGRVQSTMQLVGMSAMPLAPVVAGTALTILGGPLAVAVLGILVIVVALIVTLSRSVREVPRPTIWRDRGVVRSEAAADALAA